MDTDQKTASVTSSNLNYTISVDSSLKLKSKRNWLNFKKTHWTIGLQQKQNKYNYHLTFSSFNLPSIPLRSCSSVTYNIFRDFFEFCFPEICQFISWADIFWRPQIQHLVQCYGILYSVYCKFSNIILFNKNNCKEMFFREVTKYICRIFFYTFE